MTRDQAKRYVIVSTVGVGTLGAVKAFRTGSGPTARQAFGVVASGAMLAILAELAPGIAGGLAILALTTAALVLGGDAWQGITTATKPEPITPTR